MLPFFGCGRGAYSVRRIFGAAGEYTYSTLAKTSGSGGKGENAAGILRRSRCKTVRVACIPFAVCAHICSRSCDAAATDFRRCAYEKIRTDYFRQKIRRSAKNVQIFCLYIRYNWEEVRE